MEKIKILIVDDEESVLKMYKIAFDQSGFEPILASSGTKGIEIAKAQNPKLILLDILMPEINGLDVLKELKQDEKTKNIPVYLLTNLQKGDVTEKAMNLGAEKYFMKADYEPQLLADEIKKTFK
jgi:DNA-binding response OmpR family regulator